MFPIFERSNLRDRLHKNSRKAISIKESNQVRNGKTRILKLLRNKSTYLKVEKSYQVVFFENNKNYERAYT